MKTNELIFLLENMSKIMAYYPNKKIEYALVDILHLLELRELKIKNTKEIANKKQKTILKKTNDEINSVDTEPEKSTLTTSLNNKENENLNHLSVSELKRIASNIGIKSSSRQNKSILIMNISKTIERRRIDSVIKDKDNNIDKK
ncbi:TPA: hypothetical protein ACRRYK_000104 [Morganella morganii]